MNKCEKILDIHTNKNTWRPPQLDELKMSNSVRYDVNALQSDSYLHIFKIEPYIDSIYIEYDVNRKPVMIRRFCFREGYVWDIDSEDFFHEHCVKVERCTYSGGQIDSIFKIYNKDYPEWHLQRYLTKGLRLLDHIYNCLLQDTIKEILYKSGLDELAAHIDEVDEIKLMSRKPSDIYSGLSIKVLRSLNCNDGAILLNDLNNRLFIKELNQKFPDLFSDNLNDAQCRYLHTLIKGDLTIGETGRLFRSRKPSLAKIWNKSMYDAFMAIYLLEYQISEIIRSLEKIDPLYGECLKKRREGEYLDELKQLTFYLICNREEYDRCVRRSNRKREYDWMERGEKYFVRYPWTINDLCREAVYMQNCLLAYVEAMINNDTTILFMRKSDNVNQPFITIEIYDNELHQAYHRYNNDCKKEEAEWIIDYCERHGIGTGRFKFNSEVDELY